jgi:tetratricopeptide (TPR) repeat protein
MRTKRNFWFHAVIFLIMNPCLLIAQTVWNADTYQGSPDIPSGIQKHILIYFELPDNPVCKIMNTRTYDDRGVSDLLSTFYTIRIGCNTAAGKKEASAFRIHEFPTIILLNPRGIEINRRLGFLPPAELIAWINDSLRNTNTLSGLLEKAAKNGDDLQLNLAIARKYNDLMDVETASRYYRSVIALDPMNEKRSCSAALFEMARMLAISGKFKESALLYRELLEKFPNDQLVEISYLNLVQDYVELGTLDKAIEFLRVYRDLYRLSFRAQYVFAKSCLDLGVLPEEALTAAIEANKLDSSSTDVLTVLAKAYAANGKYDKAVEILKKALQLDPGSALLREELDRCQKKNSE